MNKIKIAAALASVVGLFASCADFLDVSPTSKYSSDNLYETVAHADMAVLGVYNTLAAEALYGRNLPQYYDLDTDCGQIVGGTSTGKPDGERRSIAHYAATSATKQLDVTWSALYKGIDQANNILRDVPQMSLFKNGGNDSLKLERVLAEALALRAIFYFDLIRFWGDVPFKETPSATGQDFDLPRVSRDTIYDYIIADLVRAVDKLGKAEKANSSFKLETERLTQAAVKGLLARICLHAGGYSLRWDLETYNPASQTMSLRKKADGIVDTERIRQFYELAQKHLVDIIGLQVYDLNPSFESYWKNICQYKIAADVRESLFEIAFYSRTGVKNEAGYHGRHNGPRSAANSKYGEGAGGVWAMPGFYYQFESYDTIRRDVTIMPMKFNEVTSTSTDPLYTMDAGKPVELFEITPAKWRKQWAPAKIPNLTNFNFPLLRYSDVLLMFAEVETYLNNGSTPDAVQALRKVRKRGVIASYKNSIDSETYPSDYDGFMSVLMQERAFELSFEGFRKTDLIRWGKLADKVKEVKQINKELNDCYNQRSGSYNALYSASGKIVRLRGMVVPQSIYYRRGTGEYTEVRYQEATPKDVIVNDTWKKSSFCNNKFKDGLDQFAVGFKENESELLPLPTTVLSNSTRLKQLPGFN